MLDKIFAGESGLAALLIGLFGGEGELLTRDAAGGYESRAVPFAQESHARTEGASKTPGGRTWDTTVMSNGLRRFESKLVCLVPACRLSAAPRPGLDRFRVDGEEYRIETVESTRAGAETAAYRLTCERL